MRSGYKSNLWKLKGIRLLFWMHFFAAVLIPFYTEWGKLSLAQVFYLNSWFMFCNFALEVPTGTVADFLGRKVSLMLGSAVGALAALLYVSRPDFWVFIAAEFVFAIAYTLHSGADEALAYDSLKAVGREHESKALFASLESFKLTGILIATIVGAFIAARYGYAAPMCLYLVPAVLAFFLSASLHEPPLDRATAPAGSRAYLAILQRGARFFVHHRVLLVLTLEMAITNALAWGLIWLFQPLLVQSGVPIQYFGLVHAAGCATQIVFLANVPRLERWLGSKRGLLLTASAITGISFIALGLTDRWPAVIVLIPVAFAFSLPRIPIFNSYLNKYIPSEERATVLSLTSMVRTLSIVAINPLIGWFADRSASYTMIGLGVVLLLVTCGTRLEEHQLVD